ncbi:MAG TPA: AAA family ATPase [Actinomycetota bacterium]|nr:AAA family ATPase [Actinomycetota bacterium]
MSDNDQRKPGLSWPDHDTGPTPPPEFGDPRRLGTRRPLQMWDRIKLLVLFGVSWVVLVWATVATDSASQPHLVVPHAVRRYSWIVLLAALEVVRQIHYLLSEQSASYHRFWTETVFGSLNERTARLNPWARYRLARALKVLFVLIVADLLLARIANRTPAEMVFRAPGDAFAALPQLFQILSYIVLVVLQFGALFWFLSRGGVDTYFPEDIKTRFSDVWGQDMVLEKVQENIVHLEDPEAIEEKGGYVPGGVLLWGPPGTGKTLMAEAVAGETGRPFVFVDPGAFVNMFMGVGILKVKSLFRKLRKLALRYGGVIVFFDEADSLGNRGAMAAGQWGGKMQPASPACNGMSYLSPDTCALVTRAAWQPAPADETGRRGFLDRVVVAGMGGGGGMGTLQALLSEISGLKKPRGFFNRVVRRALGMRPKPPPKYRILVIMATNMPQSLDEALLRPGRIDRIYKVGYPSREGRIRTYEGYLSRVRHNLSRSEVEKLATITPYATGASIRDLVNEALISSVREGREWITWQDVIRARLFKTLGPSEDVEYIERDRHAVAIHEACHAVAAYRIRRHLAIDIATIEKASDYLGMVSSIPLEEQFIHWRSEYESDIGVSLAALAGERIFYDGDNSSGVTSDLKNATTVGMFMEGYWAMGETLGSHLAVKTQGGNAQQVVDGASRNLLETDLGRRIEQRLEDVMKSTSDLISKNRREVLAVAHALETHKTLTGDDVEAVIEGRVGPLIDGRPYGRDDFMAVAEAYHDRILTAQRHGTKVDVTLPVFDADSRWTLQRPVATVAGHSA